MPLAAWEVQLETTLWCSPVVKELGAKTDVSQFYCTWPCDLMLSAPEKVIYLFSLIRKGTRRNSMRHDLGNNGVKISVATEKRKIPTAILGSDTSLMATAWNKGGTRFWWNMLAQIGKSWAKSSAKVKLPSERTILSSAWEHSVCKSWITVLCSLALPHKKCFITEQRYTGVVGLQVGKVYICFSRWVAWLNNLLILLSKDTSCFWRCFQIQICLLEN